MTTLPVQQLYIHGQRVDATSGKTFKTVNPATGDVIAEVQVASQADVERAVQSAAEGQKVWAAMTAMERSRILRRAVEILRERNDELAHRKPWTPARRWPKPPPWTSSPVPTWSSTTPAGHRHRRHPAAVA
ncbi:aldehyde dehydrogenase family protein [Stenotrophomonas sp. CD2]|nr:aldehyde dehydrogenase family protein [Stenotrophomonas sp. CD2]